MVSHTNNNTDKNVPAKKSTGLKALFVISGNQSHPKKKLNRGISNTWLGLTVI